MPYTPVPDITDAERLEIVQANIRMLRFELFKYEAGVRGLPIDDEALPQMGTLVTRTQAILDGYRAQEGELVARLVG